MVGRLFTSKNTVCATFAQLLHKTQPRNPEFTQNFAQFFEVVENFVGRPRPSRKRNLLKNKWVTLFGMPNDAFESKQKLPATLRNRLHNLLRACVLRNMRKCLNIKHLAPKHREEQPTSQRKPPATPDNRHRDEQPPDDPNQPPRTQPTSNRQPTAQRSRHQEPTTDRQPPPPPAW